jgi:UDP-N-acetylmuramoyl-tripeptide--D-alanyl-D-alanine ligase
MTAKESLSKAVRLAMLPAAFLWRRLLPRTTFIAVTGSFGKTTCTELLAATLSRRYCVIRTNKNWNSWNGVASTILRTMPWHRYAVVEAATWQSGALARSAAMIRPDIAIILTVGNTHRKRFHSIDAIAAEKATLLSGLQPSGLAVLNADDPRVAAMADGKHVRVLRIGSGEQCDLQGETVPPVEPGRFSLRVRCVGQEIILHTRLYGPHWSPPVLAALAVARECGVPLAEAASAIENLAPITDRLQLVTLANGVQFLRDDYNCSMDSVAPALSTFAALPAARKIFVLSYLADSDIRPRNRSAEVTKQASSFAQVVVCIGLHARHGVRGAIGGGMDPGSVFQFATVKAAADFLHPFLRSGDLVLAKGGGHLARIFLSFDRPIACWGELCRLTALCDHCPKLQVQS